jgi:hypothetical protein
MDVALKRGGLSFADIEPVYLRFPSTRRPSIARSTPA